jgi:hypothetical protein
LFIVTARPLSRLSATLVNRPLNIPGRLVPE